MNKYLLLFIFSFLIFSRQAKSLPLNFTTNQRDSLPVKVYLGPDTSLCPGFSLRLAPRETIAGATYSWSTGDTTWNVLVTQPGTYWLAVTYGNKVSADTIVVTNNCRLKANFTAQRVNNGLFTMKFTEFYTGLRNYIGKRKWNFGDGTSSSAYNPAHTYAHPGDYLVTLWVADTVAHQEDSISHIITIRPPVTVNLGQDTTIAPGTGLVLDGVSAVGFWDHDVTWLWSTGDTSRSITVTQPGTYWLKATMYGRSASDTIVVRHPQQQRADFSYSRANNGQLTMNFTAVPAPGTGNATYLWNFGDYTTGTGSSVSHTYSQAGIYQVYMRVKDSLHVIDSVRRQVEIIPFVSVNLGPDTTILPGHSITLDAVTAIGGIWNHDITYLWSTGDTSRTITISQPGTYKLKVSMYGRTVSDSIRVLAFMQARLSNNYTLVKTSLTDLGVTVRKLNVFPNPSNGVVYLKLEKVPATSLVIEVYNSSGTLVRTEIMKDRQIRLDLSTQPKGVYYIQNKGADKEKATPIVIQ